MEKSTSEQLHVNWKALASVNFKFKVFKKSSESDQHSNLENNHEANRKIELDDGIDASHVYQEILQIPSTSIKNKTRKMKTKKKMKVTKKLFVDKNLFGRYLLT